MKGVQREDQEGHLARAAIIIVVIVIVIVIVVVVPMVSRGVITIMIMNILISWKNYREPIQASCLRNEP